MSWAMVYEGRNPSKQRKREQPALLHLPTTPHKPPKGWHTTDPKQGSLRFYEGKPSWGFLKAFYFKRGGKKETFGERNPNIYKPSLLLN